MYTLSKYNVYKDDILKLNAEGKNNAEIGRILGIDSRRVSDQLRKLNLNAAERTFVEPNELQKEVIIASVLGDGSLIACANSKNRRFNLAHSLKQEKYFMMKYEILKDLLGVECKRKTQFHKKAEKEYHSISVQSKVNPYFTELYSKWYKDGKKIIPKEYINELTEFGLAIKYFDDGYKMKNGYAIAMDDYESECVEVFRNYLLEKFDIQANMHGKGRSLYVPSGEARRFKNIIEKYATDDVHYKL